MIAATTLQASLAVRATLGGLIVPVAFYVGALVFLDRAERARVGLLQGSRQWFVWAALVSAAAEIAADYAFQSSTPALGGVMAFGCESLVLLVVGFFLLQEAPIGIAQRLEGANGPADQALPAPPGPEDLPRLTPAATLPLIPDVRVVIDPASLKMLGQVLRHVHGALGDTVGSDWQQQVSEAFNTIRSDLNQLTLVATEVRHTAYQIHFDATPASDAPLFENLVAAREGMQFAETDVRALQPFCAGLFTRLEIFSKHRRDLYHRLLEHLRGVLYLHGLEEWGYEYINRSLTEYWDLQREAPRDRLRKLNEGIPIEDMVVVGVEIPGFRWSVGDGYVVASYPLPLVDQQRVRHGDSE